MAASSFNDTDSLYDFVVRDGYGVKGMMDLLGPETVPELFIHPHRDRVDELYAGNSLYCRHPVDFSMLDGPQRSQAVALMVDAAETVGFFQVVNHGVPIEVLEPLKTAAHEFFGQPPEKKAVYRKGVNPCPYLRYGTSFAAETEKALEWRDFFRMVYTTDSDALQFWPDQCRELALEYLKTSISMVRRILQVLMERLGVTPDGSRIDDLIAMKTVQMNFYPICPNPDLAVGVGRHSDMGTLTVLLQDDIGGLYATMDEDIPNTEAKRKWMEIPPIPGALVVSVGDVLEIVSNGKYKSGEHKVRTTSTQSRVSIPIFTNPRTDMMIGPLPEVVERDGVARYREVLLLDYMNNYAGGAHEGKTSLNFARINSS